MTEEASSGGPDLVERGSVIVAPEAATPPGDLRKRALASVLWALCLQGSSHFLRLANNLILTRLLFERAFGVMAIINICIEGMRMVTDVGINFSVIQSKRVDDPAFLDTAWTIHMLRGVVMWLVLCALAWPLAGFYSEPELMFMLPVAGLTTVVGGFSSLTMLTRNRELRMGRVVAVELTTQFGSAFLIWAVAWFWSSAWVLVFGLIFTEAARTTLSYVLLPGRHRFRWEKQARAEIMAFGRFTQVSSMLTFTARQIDRLLLGRLLSVRDLGIYNIGAFWGSSIAEIGADQAMRVGIPLLAEVHRGDQSRLYASLRRMRLSIVWPIGLGLCVLSAIGSWLVHFLYDPRYHEAGWMLRILAAGYVVFVLNVSAEVVWVTLADGKRMVQVNAARVVGKLTATLTGYWWNGEVGLVVGVALSDLLIYPLLSWWLWRRKLWQPEVDLPFLAVCSAVLAAGWAWVP